MPRFVTALFDDAQNAEGAVKALKVRGFKAPDIQLIGEQRVAEGFFDRLFLNENGGGPPSDKVSVMGISPGEVDDYTGQIEGGGALVILMCEEPRIREVIRLFERHGASRVASPEGEEAQRSKKKRGAVQPGRSEQTGSKKWFHVVDIDEEDPREGAKSHAVHVHPRENIHHQRSDEMPGARPSISLERFEPDFRVHYEENYAESPYSFDDCRMAYRYGLALGENPRLRRQQWEQLKQHARRGWEDHDDRPFSDFEEAVRFGWRTMRRQYRTTRWRT